MQRSDRVGVYGHFRRNNETPRSSRTVYRWQRQLGEQLLVIPNVRAERLGLRHAHVFVTQPGPGWISCPYAVEAAWVTPDLCQEALYLHCLVPHGVELLDQLKAFPCASAAIIWSGSGWQQFLNDEEAISIPVVPRSEEHTLLRRSPFVVPAALEAWHYPNSLPLTWARIQQRLGPRVKHYLPRTRVRSVNGKTHLTTAFRALKEDGALAQHLIRYHPLLAASVEVFVRARMAREQLAAMLDGLRGSLHAIETYPTNDGYWCRLLGPHRLLDAMVTLAADVRERLSGLYFHTKRHPAPIVRFAYESLFDPTTGTWRTA